MKNYIFIAVNYNNSQFTIEYVQSIINLDYLKEIRIIIVDNDSEKEDYLNLERELSDIKNLTLIRNSANIGYFKGLNIGITSINDINESIVIVSNNDVKFAPNFLVNFEKIRYDNSVMVIAPNIITSEGVHQNPHHLNRISKMEKLLFRMYYSNYQIGKVMTVVSSLLKKRNLYRNNIAYDKEIYIYQGVGACYILTENFFRCYSKLDDSVFLWGEEALLANQVDLVEGKTLYNPNIIVHHNESSSISAIPSKKVYQISKQSYKTYYKN